MRNLPLTTGLLSLGVALAMILPAMAQSSTTSPQQESPAAQSQPSHPSPQTEPSQAPAGQAQSQPAEDNPLNLSEEQKAKIRPILADENQQMEALRNDSSMTQEQKMAKANQIRQTASPKIRAILTQEQLQKLAELQRMQQQQNKSAPQDTSPPPHK